MSRRLVAVAFALLVVPALSACGEDEQEAFAQDFGSLDKQVAALDADVEKTVRGAEDKTDKQVEDEFGKLAQQTGELAQRAGELEPPDELQPETEDLTESLGDAQDALRDIQKAAADSDPPAAREASIQLVTSLADLRDSRRALERATR